MIDNSKSIINSILTALKPIPPDMKSNLEIPRNIKAILFDIYGTLLISGTGDISLASLQGDTLDMDKILKGSGFSTFFTSCSMKIPSLMNKFITARHDELRLQGIDYPEVDIRTIWEKVLGELWLEGLLNENPENKSVDLLALRHELSVNPVWPMPGFPEIVLQLKNAGYHVGIVSNAQFYTPLIMEALTGQTLEEIGFDLSLCAWSYENQLAKPSSEIFDKPLKKLADIGIKPSEVLYIGNDMLNDVTAASTAGCRTALFAGDRRSLRLRDGDKRVKTKPDMIITELKQIESLIP